MCKLLGASLLILWLQLDWVKSQQKNGDQQIKQNPPSLSVQEGGISILNCDYETMFDFFQWHKKYLAESPTFLISIRSALEKNKDGRFTVFHNRSARHLSAHLVLPLGDSALYLCSAGHSDPQAPAVCTQTCHCIQASPALGSGLRGTHTCVPLHRAE
uniref:T cell receptor alpha variable 29/delta variable 5 n=1 Tax=Catagonus wagneri TaxID=51154 RepID=A0A8C3VQF1_9CETA